eukprot:4536067-Amphidinium_carterae.1
MAMEVPVQQHYRETLRPTMLTNASSLRRPYELRVTMLQRPLHHTALLRRTVLRSSLPVAL